MIPNVFLTDGYGKKKIISFGSGDIYKNIYESIGCNRKKTKTSQISINSRIDKSIVVHSYKVLLYENNEPQLQSTTSMNLKKPNAQCKILVTEEYIKYD